MSHNTPTLKIFEIALKKIANYFIRDFAELEFLQNSNKNSMHSFANKTFEFVENKLLDDLQKFKPAYNFILGSGKIIKGTDTSNTIVINSISGFNNYCRGIPFFATSLCLIRDGNIFASAVFNPLNENLFVAEDTKGAFFNKKRLRIEKPNNELIIATDKTKSLNLSNTNYQLFISGCKLLELCYLASSKIDICIYNEPTKYYEVAPALIFLKEVGLKLEFTKNDSKSELTNLTAGSIYALEIFNK